MNQWIASVRQLARRRAFSGFAIVLLGVGVAANTSVFCVADAVLLKPLAYPEPNELVYLLETNSSKSQPESLIAPARLQDWNRMAQAFKAIAGFNWDTKTELSGNVPERLQAYGVTKGYFQVYNVKPFLGRTFSKAEQTFGGPNAVVLSYSFWNRRFGRARDVLGKTLRLGSDTYTIVGVMPPHFVKDDLDIWYSYNPSPDMYKYRDARFLSGIGRVKPGVRIEDARADLTRVQKELGREYPETDKGWGVELKPLKEEIVGDRATAVWTAFAAVSLFFVLACSNIGALLLGEAQHRRNEMAIRASLGATRWQLAAALLREVTLLAVAGSALGVLCSVWLLAGIREFMSTLPRVSEVSLDWRALLFTVIVVFAAVVLAGLAPALFSSQKQISADLVEGNRTQAGTRSTTGQQLLVFGQVSLTVALLATAGLLLKSYGRLNQLNPGFSSDHVLTFHISAAWAEDRDAIGVVQEAIVRTLQNTPGVVAAGVTNFLPADDASLRYQYRVSGITSDLSNGALTAGSRMVTGGYLSALHVPLVAGKNCPDGLMTRQANAKAIVNRAFVQRFAGGQNIIGRQLEVLGAGIVTPFDIIGVIGDMREDTLRIAPSPYVYTCATQGAFPDMEYVVRTRGNAAAFATTVRNIVHRVAPQRAVFGMKTMQGHLEDSLQQPRLTAQVLTGFALLALVLAASGLYSLCNLTVLSRTREIGTRMALGARGTQVVQAVLSPATATLMAGVCAGIGLALGAGVLIKSQLFSVGSFDTETFGTVLVVLITSAFTAMLVPALRAARIDPVKAMRQQ